MGDVCMHAEMLQIILRGLCLPMSPLMSDKAYHAVADCCLLTYQADEVLSSHVISCISRKYGGPRLHLAQITSRFGRFVAC